MKKNKIIRLLTMSFSALILFLITSCSHEHAWVLQGKEDATCLTDGYVSYKCNECNETKNEVFLATKKKKKIIPEVEATCKQEGLTEGVICEYCNEILVRQNETPKTDHKEEILHRVEPTCSTLGLTEGKKCNVCGEILVAQEEVAQLDHIPGAEASFTSAQTCTVCNEVLVPQVKTITVYYYNTEKWTKVDIYLGNKYHEK